MNMFKSILLVIAATMMFTACNKAQYLKTKGGMPYQLYKGKDTQQIKAGDFIKIHLMRKVKDSVYFSTFDALPAYIQVTTAAQPYDISELWTSLQKGDSVIATQMIDTFINRTPQSVPPQYKKGDKITIYIKVLEIFSNDSLARADYEKSNNQWLANEIKTIEKYLADKSIQAQRTPSGVFVEIKNPGTGSLADSGKYVSVNYTGTSWSGVKFDSNTDPAFQHVQPMPFVVGTGAMLKGFDEAVRVLRKGGTARFYIPSVLAYAGNPDSPKIKPYEHLIFDIEIVDVQDKMPPPPATREDMPPGMPEPNQ